MAKRTGRAGETFFARQVRMLLRADFRRGETVSIGGGTVSRGDQTLAAYLRAGRTERFFDRAFTLGLGVIMLIGTAFMVGAVVAAHPPFGWSVVLVLLALLTLYLGLRQLAGWRCMRRQKR